jgi:hypothetical protein
VRAIVIWLACMALGAVYVASRPATPPHAQGPGASPSLRIDDWLGRPAR